MTDIIIAAPEHLAQLMEIEKAYFSPPWSENAMLAELNSPDACVIAAIDGDDILGFAVMHRAGDDGELYQIAVREKSRRRGIADELMKKLDEYAFSYQTVFLEVRESNAPAVALYKKHGFEVLGIRKNYYDSPRENAVIMSKTGGRI